MLKGDICIPTKKTCYYVVPRRGGGFSSTNTDKAGGIISWHGYLPHSLSFIQKQAAHQGDFTQKQIWSKPSAGGISAGVFRPEMRPVYLVKI